MNTMITLVRRELIEHRSIFLAPAILTAIILVAALYGVGQGLSFSNEITGFLGELDTVDPARARAMLSTFLGASLVPFWLPFNLVMSAVFLFYLLDCLQSERKDRSILFWRSLPVSDTQTVLSKLLTALIAIPAVELIASLLAFVLNAIVVSVGLAMLGENPVTLLWLSMPWFSGTLFLFYSVLTQSLWFAPFAGWFLLVSSAARNVPILWAIGIPGAIAYLEYLLFDSWRFAMMIGAHLQGWPTRAYRDDGNFSFDEDFAEVFNDSATFQEPMSLLSLADPVGFLASPALWVGLVLTAGFVAVAIRMRRYHDV
jgi:ABC-2 type transport system permease protein